MNILYIGAGFVGATSAAVAADSGHKVLLYDINEHRIAQLSSADRETIEAALFEEGLADLLIRHRERIHMTVNTNEVAAFLETADAVFLCLPTPEIGETGQSDLSFYTAAIDTLAPLLKARNGGAQQQYLVIVNKSTVPILLADEVLTQLTDAGVQNIGVVSNPEFLVEGKAVAGSLKPDRIVVGAWTEQEFAQMRHIYQRFYDAPNIEYIEVNPREAAAGKLLANFYLFQKLMLCFDVTGRVTEAFPNVQFEHVRRVVASDHRIGSWGFYNSVFAGGSCFIKDARSLSYQLREAGKEAALIEQAYDANQRQLVHFCDRLSREAGQEFAGKRVAMLGTAFKRDTNDIRNAASTMLLPIIERAGAASVTIYDPVAAALFEQQFVRSETRRYALSAAAAIADADIILITADWPEFRGLADDLLTLSHKPIIMDGRRMLQHRYDELRDAGFTIIAVGSPLITPHT